MSIQYFPADEYGKPYWIAYDPTFQDIEDMIYAIGVTNWYNFVVVGVPCEISPQWVAKHEGYVEGNYEYAVSYSIYKDDFTSMLENEEADTVTDMFNFYLEGTGKCWREIEQLKLVDRRKPWEGTM